MSPPGDEVGSGYRPSEATTSRFFDDSSVLDGKHGVCSAGLVVRSATFAGQKRTANTNATGRKDRECTDQFCRMLAKSSRNKPRLGFIRKTTEAKQDDTSLGSCLSEYPLTEPCPW